MCFNQAKSDLSGRDGVLLTRFELPRVDNADVSVHGEMVTTTTSVFFLRSGAIELDHGQVDKCNCKNNKKEHSSKD